MPSALEPADIDDQVKASPDIFFSHAQLQVDTAANGKARQSADRFICAA
jgi:hypothetical protein